MGVRHDTSYERKIQDGGVFKNRVLTRTFGLKSEGKQLGDGKFSSDKIQNVQSHSKLVFTTV